MTLGTKDDDLPTEYDVIVIGTGMTESVVAAAASRIGKRVLHIDSNDYYGGLWASFNLEGLCKWIKECESPPQPSQGDDADSDVKINNGEEFVPMGNQFTTVSNIIMNWQVPKSQDSSVEQWSRKSQTNAQGEKSEEETPSGEENQSARKRSISESEKMPARGQSGSYSKWSQDDVMKEYRRFNIDLAPKLLYARGPLVELLISSNIARYTEFRAVTRVITWLEGRLSPVPCSRADVFATRHVSVVEKRMLMKLLTSCMENDNMAKEFEGFDNKSFKEYLKSKHLTPHLLHYVLYAIAMGTDDMPCREGVERTQHFLNSLGRYGNTPFLWPMYGSGELPQAFCRLCAVFGGVYCLQRPAKALLVNENRCVGVVSSRQRLVAEHVVMGVGHAPKTFLASTTCSGLSRAVFITNRSIMPADKEPLTLLKFPPGPGHPEPVTVIEVGPSTNACPRGLFLVHMTCRQQRTAKEDLETVVKSLLRDEPSTDEISTDTQSTQTPKTSAPPQEEESNLATDSIDVTSSPPQVLWSFYFNCPETSTCDFAAGVPENVYLCSGPDLELDFDFAVKQAEEIFKKMYADEEFLPRAPDPEEIVLDGGDAPGPAFNQEDGAGCPQEDGAVCSQEDGAACPQNESEDREMKAQPSNEETNASE